MVVTVILSGVPWHVNLEKLSKRFDKIFDRDEIGSFRVRDLHGYTSEKRKLALDFESGYDAMTVQQILDGFVYRSDDDGVSFLKARVQRNTSPQRSNTEIVPSSNSSRASTFGMIYQNVSSEELLKTKNCLDAQLQVLEKQKLVFKAERELIKEKKKLYYEYSSTRDGYEISYKSNKRSRKRYSSESSEDSRRRARSKSPKNRRIRSPSRRRSPSPVHYSRRRLSRSISSSSMERRSSSPPHRKRGRMLLPAGSRVQTWSQEASTSRSSNNYEYRGYRKSKSPMHPKASSGYGREEKMSVIDLTEYVKTKRPYEDSQDHYRLDHDRLMLKDMAKRSISRSSMDRRSRSPPHRIRERMLSPAGSRVQTWSQEASTSRSSNNYEYRGYRKSKSPMHPKASSGYGREEKMSVIDLTDYVKTKKPYEDSQDHYRLDHDRLTLKDMAKIYGDVDTDPYSQTPVAYDPVATSTQNDNIWTAVDEVLQDVHMDVFETNDAPSKVKIEKPIPENALFVTPIRSIMRQMRKHITEIEKECKQIYQIARQVIRDRIKEIMVGEDYTRSAEIVCKYRKVYSTNGDADFLEKLRDEIYAGKYAEELKGSDTLPKQTEAGDEGNNNNQMVTEDSMTMDVKGSEPLPEPTKEGDAENGNNHMTTEDIVQTLQN